MKIAESLWKLQTTLNFAATLAFMSTALFKNIPVTITVDTGASTTILSNRIFQKIPVQHKPHLTKNKHGITGIVGAGGGPLNFHGTGKFTISLGPSLQFDRERAVADISDDMLLGADILQKDEWGPVNLLLSQNRMKFGNTFVSIQQIGVDSKLRRARLADHTVIPGMNQVNADVLVDSSDSDGAGDSDVVMIESKPLLAKEHSVVLGPTLVDCVSKAGHSGWPCCTGEEYCHHWGC